MIKPLVPCLWFNNQAEEAVTFYLDIFPHSKIEKISRYGKEGFEYHGMPEGTVLTIDFTINGMSFTALNGGPMFSFTEAVSFQVLCDTQDEIDYYWSRLTDGGEESMCGWLKDKFGLSWQIIPSILSELMNDPERSGRVAQAFLQMRKFDIEKILNA